MRDCSAVPFKQWGGVRKSGAGRMLEGRTDGAMRQRKDRRATPDPARLAIIEGVKG